MVSVLSESRWDVLCRAGRVLEAQRTGQRPPFPVIGDVMSKQPTLGDVWVAYNLAQRLHWRAGHVDGLQLRDGLGGGTGSRPRTDDGVDVIHVQHSPRIGRERRLSGELLPAHHSTQGLPM